MRKIRRTAVYLLAFLGGLFLVVTIIPIDSWYAHRLAGSFDDPNGDVLVVLGGEVDEGILGPSSYLRARYAALAYKQGGFKRVVISGGGSPVAVSDAMADLMRSAGVPADAIITEARARSTRENAMNTALMLNSYPGRKVLLTSDFHMFRSVRAFRKAGVEVIARPIPDAMKRAQRYTGRWAVFLELLEETEKITYYYVRRWI